MAKGTTSHRRSPNETSRIHGGEYEGAGELPAVGPGKAAMRVNTSRAANIPGPAASGAAPKGMTTDNSGE